MAANRPITLMQEGAPYLERWFIVPRNNVMNVYLHRFLQSDRITLHDHRGDNRSWLLKGQYVEVTKAERRLVTAGETVFRRAEEPHRVELVSEEPAISLFAIGPIRREWGFHTDKGWMAWQPFLETLGDRQ